MRVQYIYNKLKESSVNGKIEIGFRRIEDINKAHSDLRRLDRFYEPDATKNVILDLSSQDAYRKILKQIPEVGMNREGYNYLMGTLDMLSLNLSRFRHGGVNITGFQLVNHTSGSVRKFLSNWTSLESNVWPGAGTPVLDCKRIRDEYKDREICIYKQDKRVMMEKYVITNKIKQ
ncbi:hypothetical protein LOTGIDRAFT_173366 [Lottia gigantea]|uniref:Receptor ligand binding region domain-containing protein n=1 Tax=Lottia gigantea TaxID=225164 RepID=V4B1L1_LOTGI|nr:hypothetical protein LOTGIDRAFT_173366 [Lottia gigantea]ESP00207.1 hypothetical protein LOTGIDRAFT_173366 [Lottia gigantea]